MQYLTILLIPIKNSNFLQVRDGGGRLAEHAIQKVTEFPWIILLVWILLDLPILIDTLDGVDINVQTAFDD